MYCKNCGADMEPGTAFCPNCGMRAGEPEPQQPETHYEAPQGNTHYNAVPVHEEKSCNPTLWIILSAVEFLLCCQWIPGIIGLIFAIMAASAKSEGNTEKAGRYCKYAMIAVIVGAVLFVLCIAVFIIFMAATGLTLDAIVQAQPYISEYVENGIGEYGYYEDFENFENFANYENFENFQGFENFEFQ